MLRGIPRARHPERSITVYVKSSSPEKKRSESKDLLAKPLRAICFQILRLMPRVVFIRLEPYPARYARHLPHAGKAFRYEAIVFLRSLIRIRMAWVAHFMKL